MAHKKWNNTVKHASGKTTREYNLWIGIIRRCREGSTEQQKNIGYVGCTYDESWSDFDVFCEWLRKKPFWNSSDHNGVWYEPEKDMFSVGCKRYDDSTVVFVPNCINNFIVSAYSATGVTYNKRLCKYVAQVSDSLSGREKIHLGVFSDIEQAKAAYFVAKTDIARKMALFYYNMVEKRVTERLLTYGEVINAAN